MIRLAATTEKIQAVLAGAVSATQPQAIVCYSDQTASSYSGGKQLTALNSTTDVDILAAPAASTVRDVDYLSIFNRDSAGVTVTIKYDVSGTDSIIITVTLATLETLIYIHAAGWMVMTATGGIKTPGGTVTSVTFTAAPTGIFDVANPTISTSGTIALSMDSQSANQFLAGPASGSAAAPAFRAVVAADLPMLEGTNLLVNPGFAIDQIVHSATSVADDIYCLDCWYVLTQTAAIQVTQQTNQENGTPFNVRLTQNQASAQRMGLAQIIESSSCRDARGNALAESLRVRISSSQAVRYAILEWTGTADSVTSDVVNDWTSSTYTAGNFFLGSNLTVTAVGSITPSGNTWTDVTVLTGTCGSSVNNVVVFVWTEGTAAQNVTLDVGRFKLEFGAAGTAYRDPDYPTEFNKATRYFKRIGGDTQARYGAARTTGVGSAELIMYLPIPMRLAPTITVNNVTSWSTNDATVQVAWVTVASTLTSRDTVNINVTNGVVVANRPAFMTPNNANATIDIDARL